MNLQDQNGGRTAGGRDILLRGRPCVPELILSWGTFFYSPECHFLTFIQISFLVNDPDHSAIFQNDSQSISPTDSRVWCCGYLNRQEYTHRIWYSMETNRGTTNGTEQSPGIRHESTGIMWWHPRRFPPCPHGQGIHHGLNVHSVT
jgi:hypothetical protein